MEKAELGLRNYLDRVLDDLSYKPRDIVVKPISSGGANYTSGLFKVTVTSPGKDKLHLFSKVAIVGEAMREKIMCGALFAQERFVYEDLKKAYNSLQTKYAVPEKDRFHFAKYYGSDLKPGYEVFLLEDLNEKGFQIYDRFHPLNWDHVSENIRVLANFHALSIALEKENPKLFGEIVDNNIAEGMSDIVRGKVEFFIEGLSEDHKTKLRKFFKKHDFGELIAAFFKPYGKKVVVHSDFKPSNIMYKEEGSQISVIPVDFQTVRIGCAVSDVLYFVLMATDGALRRTHFERLLELYHSELASRLVALGIDAEEAYPRQQFDEEVEKMLPAMLSLSLMMYPILLLPAADALAVHAADADLGTFAVRPHAAASARLAELVDDFIRWKILS